ncbi:RES family NAD+ phosphorylase [Arenibaculum pallidiluteum]|uniref:RES family NAD+ phosphorylase n=1 Tax=Arenibaculum pallidiluteum TaxID=2812559 RepID=UPI001A95C1B0|nr:RES family NAD+ phosphorylase [Arenibaculum pallidiluteum]
MSFPSTTIPGPTYRLIPSRFPPIPAFQGVASAEDLQAVMELEGWTNDRLVIERLARLPRAEWVFGAPNASVVMASFLHAPAGGARFNTGELGAWYAGMALRTAIAEVAHHLRREAIFRRRREMRLQLRAYVARLDGLYADIRGQAAARPDLYSRDSYAASQPFGEAVRAGGGAGIVYDSVRHAGGTCAVAYRPRNILDVTQADHLEITAPVRGRIVARTLP